MKISEVDTARLGPVSAVVRVKTDDGVVGYGEASENRAPRAVFEVIERIAEEYLIGADPRPIERHRRYLQDVFIRHEGVVISTAISGICQAFWDIKGKVLDVPVYELLGGPVRDAVRTYTWIGIEEEDRKNLPEQAVEAVDRGFDAVKFYPMPTDTPPYPRCIPVVRDVVGGVRDAVGDDVDIMLDPTMRWKFAEARHILSELEEFRPLFAEDFAFSYRHLHPQSLEKLAESTVTPIAVGSDLFRLSQFEELIRRDAAAVLQPDIAHAGISEIKKIAAAAEHHDIRIAPHNPFGPVGTAAAIHVDLSVPNFLIQETSYRSWPEGQSLGEHIETALEFEDGYIPAPDAPGLGVTIDEAVFEEEFDLPEPAWYSGAPGTHSHLPEW
jgi:galactonate dehydratase